MCTFEREKKKERSLTCISRIEHEFSFALSLHLDFCIRKMALMGIAVIVNDTSENDFTENFRFLKSPINEKNNNIHHPNVENQGIQIEQNIMKIEKK